MHNAVVPFGPQTALNPLMVLYSVVASCVYFSSFSFVVDLNKNHLTTIM